MIDCNMARCVWALMDEDLTEHIMANEIPYAQQWLFFLMETVQQQDFVFILVIMWSIWWAGNELFMITSSKVLYLLSLS